MRLSRSVWRRTVPHPLRDGANRLNSLALLLALLFVTRALADDWPHLRGPAHNGLSNETGLAESWPEAGPPVVWSKELGAGYSGFVVSQNRLFTQSQSLYGQYLLCLDAQTGETLWEYRYDLPYESGGLYPGPRSTPTISGGRVYFVGPRGDLHCLTVDKGKPIWSLNLIEKFAGKGLGFGYAASPLVIDGKVVLPVGGKGASVVALNAHDGATVWTSGSEPASYASPLPIVYQGRKLVVTFLQNALSCFDLTDGELLWEHKYSQGYDEHSAQPLYVEPHLLTASPFRGGHNLYRLESADATDEGGDGSRVIARLVRSSPAFSNDVVSSIVLDGMVYGFDLKDIQSKLHRPSRGEFRCFGMIDGEVRWSTEQVGQASAISADGKLLLFNDRGQVLLARATPTAYEELGRTSLFSNGVCWTAPALSDGRLFLRGPSRMVCLFVGRPEALADKSTAALQTVADLPQAASFNLAWLVGGEREFPFDPPSHKELLAWYLFSLLTIGLAGVVIALIWLIARMLRRTGIEPFTHHLLLFVTFVLGLALMPFYNQFWPEFVFVWPVSLLASFQALVVSFVWARKHLLRRRARCWILAAEAAFLLICWLYFDACWRLGMPIEWVFLTGFVGAFPIAVLAAIVPSGKLRFLLEPALLAVSFSAYFGTCAAFIAWRLQA